MIVVLNKIDRLIVELKIPPNDAYFKIKHTLEEINQHINSEDHKVSPLLNNVLFASSKYSFCFSLDSYSKMYSSMMKIDHNFLFKILWGNYYFNSEEKKFNTFSTP